MPKRKSLSSPMDGTLTSSRSEIFVHRTRSGHARPDPKSRAAAAATSSSAINSLTAVKDLRTKRIFSDRTEKMDLGSDLADLSENALIDPNNDPMAAEMEERTLGLDPNSSNMQQSNLRTNQVSDNSEEALQPVSKRGIEADQMKKNLGMESTNLSKTRWGLSPCSRLKVNGNPSSFSYKRLLPYLKDIYKDESSDRKILHSNNLSIRVENTTENRPSFLSADDLSKQQNHMVALDNSSIAVIEENQGFEENSNLECQVDILQTTKIESPDLYCQRKLNVQQIIGKMGTNDKGMTGINRLEETSDFKEHYKENSQDVLQITTVQSPDTYSGRKLQVHEATKMDTGANGIIHINAIETEEPSEKIDGSNTEITIGCDVDSIQGTPPDADLVNKFDDATWKRSSISGQESCNTSRKRPGLSPCSRLKVNGNPSSFSYKRLLPYLKDIYKDESSDRKILHSNNLSIRVENTTENRPSFLSADDLSKQQNHMVALENSSIEENQGFEENSNLKCQVDILQTTTIESPDLYCQRKLNVQQIVCKMGTNDKKGMTGINRLEETSDFKEHYKANSQDVLQIATVQSPDRCSARKLQVHEAPKMDTNVNGIIHINAIETEETSEKIDGSNTEITVGCDDVSIQGTPPDADLVNKFDDAAWKRSSISGQESCNTSRKRPEPSSCSRLKLFQNLSNSFSYKRLLPYIMDLVKDGSSDMEILDRNNYATKVEKEIEERSLLSNNDPPPSEQQHTIPLGDSSTVTPIVNQHSDEKCDSKKHGLCSNDVDNPVTMVSPNSCNEGRVEIIEYKSELPIQKSDYEIEMLCEPSYCSSTIREDLSVQELAGNTENFSHSSIKMDRKPLHGVPQIGGKGALAPRKGILKKQARGCRGICTCLDCASFRVHAERAFEFSRKQMVEADDVAERLLKELSCLRNLVERFVEPIVDSTGTCAGLQLNQLQVQGVCQRALRVEEAAKSRMREMILDLNTHCRIPKRRVTFSEYIEKQEYHIAGYQKSSS